MAITVGYKLITYMDVILRSYVVCAATDVTRNMYIRRNKGSEYSPFDG